MISFVPICLNPVVNLWLGRLFPFTSATSVLLSQYVGDDSGVFSAPSPPPASFSHSAPPCLPLLLSPCTKPAKQKASCHGWLKEYDCSGVSLCTCRYEIIFVRAGNEGNERLVTIYRGTCFTCFHNSQNAQWFHYLPWLQVYLFIPSCHIIDIHEFHVSNKQLRGPDKMCQ